MVTTQENSIAGLSGIKKKTSLDVDLEFESASGSLQSPYLAANNSAPVTSPHQLQHLRSVNPHPSLHKSQQNNKWDHHQYSSSDCCFQSSGCSCSQSETTHSESSSCCSCGESESEGEFEPSSSSYNNTHKSPSVPEQKGFAIIKETLPGPSRSSFLKSKKKEQYRIRFEIKEEDSQVHPLKQPKQDRPSSSTSGGVRLVPSRAKSFIEPTAKSSGDSGLTTSSYLSHSYYTKSRTQTPIPASLTPYKNSSVVEQKQNLSHIPANSNHSTISASCNNISTTSYKKIDGFIPPLELQTLTKKPKRTKSLRKLLTKSKSFVFSSSKNSLNSRSDLATAKYKLSSDWNTTEPCKRDVSNVSKWLRGFKRDVAVNQEQFLSNHQSSNQVCQSCGGVVTQSQDFSTKKYPTLQGTGIHGKEDKHGYEQRSWLEMNSEDIYSYGRYTRLPTTDNLVLNKKHDHPDFLSLRHQNRSKSPSCKQNTNNFNQGTKSKVVINIHDNQKDKEQYQGHAVGNKGGGGGDDGSKHKLYYNNKCTKENNVNGVQQVVESSDKVAKNKSVTTMANYQTFKQHKSGHTAQSVEFLDQDEYHSFYDCRIPRPKLKFVIPTHSYGVNSANATMKNLRRKQIDIVDATGFTEISLSDNENDADDTAYGSGSGSQSSKSSKFRSEHSSEDTTLSEFEREQELSIVNGKSHRLLGFKRSLWSKHTVPSQRGKSDQLRIVELLKDIPLFRKLSSGFLTKLSDHVNEVSYDCGEYLIQQGSRGEGLFILISGTAKVTFLSNLNGEEVYLRTVHPGDFFGEKSLQGERVNMMNVMTTDETATSLIITEDGFTQLMTKSPEFRSRFCDKSRQTFVDEYFERIELDDLRLISTLGIGGFGRVELVTLASDQTQSFALKMMKKCQIVATRQVEHIKSEKAILMETNCDFITKLHKTFKDDKYLYMLMECCLGGELWTILRDRGHFNDVTTRFYVGCVLEALKYLHNRNIIYRDLKPENLLLDPKGYLKLVDFGFAKRLEASKTFTFCGTPEYVAPEVILNKGHGVSADYWSLGVLMYELLTGTPPFVGGDPMRTYKLILKGIDYLEFPETITKHAYSLIRKLCRENPDDRLGSNRGLSEIKRHKWFDGLDWNALRSKNLTPPIIPCVKGPHDCGNFDEYPPDRSVTPSDDIRGWDWDF